MHDAERASLSPHQSSQVRQTRHITGGDDLRASAHEALDSIGAHACRYVRLDDAKAAAETATLVGALGLHQRQMANSPEQLPCRIRHLRARAQLARAPEPELPEAMTALLQADAVRKRDIEAPYAEHVHQKLTQLDYRGGALGSAASNASLTVQCRRATPRWANDVIVTGERRGEISPERTGGSDGPRVDQRLPTTRLPPRDVHAHPPRLEQLERRPRDVRIELIDVARHEQSDAAAPGIDAHAGSIVR